MNSSASPLTGSIKESDVIIDFGEFEGRTVAELHTSNPDFYEQLVEEKASQALAIRRNRDKTFHLYLNPVFSKTN